MKKSNIETKNMTIKLNDLRIKVFVSLWFFLVAGTLSSQTVNQLNMEISNMLSSPLPQVVSEGEHLKSLVSDLHPTLVFQNGEFVQYGGELSVKLECGMAFVNELYQVDDSFATVEMILIKIQTVQDLQTVVQLDALAGFPALKYVFFLCDIDPCPDPDQGPGCEQGVFSAMVQGTGAEGLKILYKVSVPM